MQAQIAKKNMEQFRALKEAQQKKLDFERTAALKQIELEQQEARRRIEQEEELHRAKLKRQLLKEETERQQRELDHEIEMQKKVAEVEKLTAEVKIREREDLKSVLGSDYDSDEESEDVTNPKNITTRNFKFQDEKTQQSQMQDILQSFNKMPVKGQVTKELEVDAVSTWLRDSVRGSKYDAPIVPLNTPKDVGIGYIPPTDAPRQ